jgi:Na+/H+-dicarboxylate symporter
MTMPAAAAAEDRPRRSLYTQLWLWVVLAITGPVIFVTVVIGIASIGNLAQGGASPRARSSTSSP